MSSAALRLLAPLFLSLTVLATPLAAQCGDSPSPMGEFLFGLSQTSAGSVELAGDLGVRWMRPGISWREVEPELAQAHLTVEAVRADPMMVESYSASVDWAGADAELRALGNAGIRAFVILGHGYAGRQPSYLGAPATPDHLGREIYLGHLYLYARAVVERYDGDGYLDAPGVSPVRYWQLENELNQAMLTAVWGWREPSFESALGSAWADWDFLTRLLQTLAEAVKTSDPTARTAVNFHTDISDTLNAALGLPSWRQAIELWREQVDIIGVDTYPNYFRSQPVSGSVVGERVGEVKSLACGKPVVVLETGYPSGPAEPGFDESSQRRFIEEAYASAVEAGVDGYFHFGSVTRESTEVSISEADLANLARVAEAYQGDDVNWLFIFANTESEYIKTHFIDVLRAVESYWGLVRADGSHKPAWATVRELALRHP